MGLIQKGAFCRNASGLPQLLHLDSFDSHGGPACLVGQDGNTELTEPESIPEALAPDPFIRWKRKVGLILFLAHELCGEDGLPPAPVCVLDVFLHCDYYFLIIKK